MRIPALKQIQNTNRQMKNLVIFLALWKSQIQQELLVKNQT